MTRTSVESVAESAFNPVTEFSADELRTIGRWSISGRKIDTSFTENEDQSRWIILKRPEDSKLES